MAKTLKTELPKRQRNQFLRQMTKMLEFCHINGIDPCVLDSLKGDALRKFALHVAEVATTSAKDNGSSHQPKEQPVAQVA